MKKNAPLFLLQAVLTAAVLVPSVPDLTQPLGEAPVEIAAHPEPMPILKKHAPTVPMPEVRLDSRFGPAPMPVFGAAGSQTAPAKRGSALWDALFDGQRSRR